MKQFRVKQSKCPVVFVYIDFITLTPKLDMSNVDLSFYID